jgi:hypothetical protein
VGIVISLKGWAAEESWFDLGTGKSYFLLQTFTPTLGVTKSSTSGVPGLSGRGLKLETRQRFLLL